VRDDNVGRRFGGLHAVRPALVVELALARRHLDLGLRLELGVLLVAEGAERRRRRVGVDAVVGRAVARAVPLRGEEALARLARAVAHLRHRLVVHRVDVGVVGVPVRRAHAALVADQDRQQLAPGHVAGGGGGVRHVEVARVHRRRAVGTRPGCRFARLLLRRLLLVQVVELLFPALTDVLLRMQTTHVGPALLGRPALPDQADPIRPRRRLLTLKKNAIKHRRHSETPNYGRPETYIFHFQLSAQFMYGHVLNK
jgi:hypothetical protein